MDKFLKKDTDSLCRLVHAATFLQLEELLHMICIALARNIENSSPEVKKEFFTLCEMSAEVFFLQPPCSVSFPRRHVSHLLSYADFVN